MKQITISLEPPCVTIDEGKKTVVYDRTLDTVHQVLELLGPVKWPMTDCLVRLVISEKDSRLREIADILSFKSERYADVVTQRRDQ